MFLNFISVLFCYKLLSVRRSMCGLNASPQALSESKTTESFAQFERYALQLSPSVPVALFVIIYAGSWTVHFER